MSEELKKAFGKVGKYLEGVKGEYEAWVLKNPSRASDTESVIRLLSYLLHGRLKQSSIVFPELIYCGANILSFWHDRLIQNHQIGKGGAAINGSGSVPVSNGVVNGVNGVNGVSRRIRGGGDAPEVILNGDLPSVSAALHSKQRESRDKQIARIKTALTIIDYLEVFLEVSARHIWGDVGRWVVILIIQSVKTGLRGALLLHYKVGMIGSSTLYQKRCNRRAVSQYQPNVTFVLKHSGRTVRKIHSAPPVRNRDWTPLPVESSSQELTPVRKIAEVIHLLRPLAHLGSMGIWGTMSWKPWLISFAMDVTSLRLHSRTSHLRRDEKLEVARRTYVLCCYLMRSPFYDTYTKKKLIGTLVMFSERIPLLGSICGILAQAIPEWQSCYSYMWTDC